MNSKRPPVLVFTYWFWDRSKYIEKLMIFQSVYESASFMRHATPLLNTIAKHYCYPFYFTIFVKDLTKKAKLLRLGKVNFQIQSESRLNMIRAMFLGELPRYNPQIISICIGRKSCENHSQKLRCRFQITSKFWLKFGRALNTKTHEGLNNWKVMSLYNKSIQDMALNISCVKYYYYYVFIIIIIFIIIDIVSLNLILVHILILILTLTHTLTYPYS